MEGSQTTEINMNGLTCGLQQELVFDDIVVEIKKKKILNNVWGSVSSGELMAVMGPSGSGKTTLLNTISGRQRMTQGSIKVNNNKVTKSSRRQIAYVLQKDIFPSKLTFREMLYFMAMIQLPEKMPMEQKKKRIDNIVAVMEMEKCLDTIMGTTINRGLSGGEMKRANIACELLTDPNIIMIDEPTSGLDSSMAFKLMLNLQKFVKDSNKIVIATIHQPSSQIFHMFHSLLILAEGRVVYHGEASRCLDTFERYGLHCAEHYNPADFILDCVQYMNDDVKHLIEHANSNKHRPSRSQSIEFNTSDTKEVSIPSNGEVSFLLPKEKTDPKWPTSFITQFYWLAWRNYKQSKSRIISKFEIARAVILSIFLGLLYFQLERTEDKVWEHKALFFFLVTHWTFQPLLEAVLSFPNEREILYKERAAGYYRLSAYYLAKIISEAPLTLVLPIFSFFVISMFAGFYRPGILFASMAVIVFHAILSQGFGILFSVIFLDIQWALTFSTIFTVINMLVAGFFAETFPSWLIWTRNVSFLAYSYNILLYLEFSSGDPIKCMNGTFSTNFGPCNDGAAWVPSNTVIESAKIELPLYANAILLVFLFLVNRSVSYVVLRYKHHPVSI